jgi:TonB family protein
MRSIVATAAVVLGLALGSLSAAADDDEVLAINPQDLPKLWTKTSGAREGEAFRGLKYRAGCAAVGFIVEPNGKLNDIKVLRAWPDAGFGDAAIDMYKSWRFEPTTMNKDRMAVYTIHTVIFQVPGAEKVLGSNRRARLDPDAIAARCAVDSVQFGG